MTYSDKGYTLALIMYANGGVHIGERHMSMEVFNKILQDANEKAEDEARSNRVADIALKINAFISDDKDINNKPAVEIVEAIAAVMVGGLGGAFIKAISDGEKTLADYDGAVEATLAMTGLKLNSMRRVISLIEMLSKHTKKG